MKPEPAPALRIVLAGRPPRTLGLPAPLGRRIADAVAPRLAGWRVSLALVNDQTLRRLHRDFLGDDSPTDVLAFPLRGRVQGPGAEVRGPSRREAFDAEVVVSFDRAGIEARRRGIRAQDELLRYAVHGLLHLAGMDDHTPPGRRAMRAAERRALRRLRDGWPMRGGAG